MKKTLFLALAFAAGAAAFALPGVSRQLEDISGEYVFYRDSSFERESYTGFVYYNESTYGVRYYAPAAGSKKQPLAEKDIQLYFTIDAAADHFEPTGERIAGTVTPDDTDIINYLHDMMYELSSRRRNAGSVQTTATSTEQFAQFGGDVTIEFNAYVPVFNIQTIKSLDGKALLQTITTGLLSATNGENADTSFTDFKGFPAKLADKSHKFKQDKKAAKAQYSYSKDEGFTQEIALDSQWTQYADNFFFLGKHDALVTFDVAIQNAEGPHQDYYSRLARRFMQSNPNSYADWSQLSIQKKGNRTIIRLPVYEQKSNTCMQLFRVLDQEEDGSLAFLLLTVYNGAYSKNQAYFDAILASYTVTAQ